MKWENIIRTTGRDVRTGNDRVFLYINDLDEMIHRYIEVRETAGKGRGVFARVNLDANTELETSPVIVMNGKEREFLDKTLLHDYIFEWGEDKSMCCMALGYVPLYNHSYESNCEYEMDFENETITVKTVKEVFIDEELTINYSGDWNAKGEVWFEVK